MGNKSRQTGGAPVVSPTVQSTPITDVTDNWKTFSDPVEGISFAYPPSYSEDALEGAVNSLEILIVSVSSDQSAYKTINYSQRANFSVSKSDKKVANCYTHPRDGSNLTQTETMNGISFKKGKQGSAAAGTTFATDFYRTLKGNICFEVALSVVVSSDWNGVERNAAEMSQQAAFTTLRQILSTFRFVQPSSPASIGTQVTIPNDWQQFTATDPDFGVQTTLSLPPDYSFRFTGSEFTLQNDSDVTELWDYSSSVYRDNNGVLKNHYTGGSRRVWYENYLSDKQSTFQNKDKILSVTEVRINNTSYLAISVKSPAYNDSGEISGTKKGMHYLYVQNSIMHMITPASNKAYTSDAQIPKYIGTIFVSLKSARIK